MQRSGMVRAFSHLPQPVRGESSAPRLSSPAPVFARACLRPRLSSPAPASRPAWAAAPEAPAGHAPADGHDVEPDDDADDGHGSEPDHDSDEGHGSSSSAGTGAHEPDDGRPWYLPRITAADLQPEGGGHDDAAKDNVGPVPRLSGGAGSFSHLPGHVEDDAADTGHANAGSHVDSAPPATAGSDTHGAIGPVSPRGASPPVGRSLFLTPRPMPPEYARQQTRTYGSAPGSRGFGGNQATKNADAPPETPHVYEQEAQRGVPWDDRPPETEPDASISPTRHWPEQHSTPGTRAEQSAADPMQQPGSQRPRPLAEGGRNQPQPPPFQVNEADENTQFDLTDQDTGRLLQKGVKFGDHARSVINEELENSPTAVAALNRARELSGKNVVIHSSNDEQASPRIGLDGTIHIYVNPKTLKPGTLAHEISHILQDWHRIIETCIID